MAQELEPHYHNGAKKMSHLARTMSRIQNDPEAMYLIHPDSDRGRTNYRMDNVREIFREAEWHKKAIFNNNFKGQYKRNKTDKEILSRMDRQGKFDSGEGLVFARQLEEIDPRRFEVIKKPLDVWKRLVPIKTFTPGIDRITYRVRDFHALAELSSAANITETALADVTAQEASNNVYAWNLGYHYTAQELRKAAIAGLPFQADKIKAVEIGYREKIQTVMLTGDSSINLEGLFNHTGVTNTQVDAPSTGTDRTWSSSSDKTATEIVADITGMTTEIFENTRGKYGDANMVVALPLAQFKFIGNERMEAGTDTTIAQFIMQNNEFNGIARFEPVFELKGIGTSSSNLAVAYPMDEEVLEAQISESIMWMPMHIKGRAFIFSSELEFGGIVIRYPVALTQRYGI